MEKFIEKKQINKQKKILYFEGAGWVPCGNVENCRIRTAYKNKNDDIVYLELLGNAAYQWDNGHIDIAYITKPTTDKNGVIHWNDCNSNQYENKQSFKYTKSEILRIVNTSFGGDFDEIVVLPNLAGYQVHKENVEKIDYESYAECPFNLSDDFVFDKARTEQTEKIAKYFYDYEKNVMGKKYPDCSVYFKNDVLTVIMHYNCYNDCLEIIDVFAFDFNYKRPDSETLKKAREERGIFSNKEW